MRELRYLQHMIEGHRLMATPEDGWCLIDSDGAHIFDGFATALEVIQEASRLRWLYASGYTGDAPWGTPTAVEAIGALAARITQLETQRDKLTEAGNVMAAACEVLARKLNDCTNEDLAEAVAAWTAWRREAKGFEEEK